MGVGNLAAVLIVPMLAHRAPDQRVLVVPSMTAMGVGLAGSLWAPLGGAWFWVLVLGVGQGACLALAIFFMMARAPDPGAAASLSAFAQSAGYLVASVGPLELGLLHSVTGSWNVPLAVLLVLCGCRAGRSASSLPGRSPPRYPGTDRPDARVGDRTRVASYLKIAAVDSAHSFSVRPAQHPRSNRRDHAGVHKRP